MRSDGFEGIHGSTSCQSHEEKEKFYHGDGLALEVYTPVKDKSSSREHVINDERIQP
jgi:hypothetical protein